MEAIQATATTQKSVDGRDPLVLENYDSPGIFLVSTPLTRNNYLSWSWSIKIALGAKVKGGFINGKCLMTNEDDANYEHWVRVDCMVTSWIVNSISKDMVEDFLYTTNAKQLWEEIKERYGECNGPLLYQL